MKVSYEVILDLFNNEIKKNTKNKRKIYRFERYLSMNITKICYVINNNLYRFMKYNIFIIKYPKYRIIMSLNIKDKLINHYVARYILMPKLERYLDIRNAATRKDMGRDYSIDLLKKYLEKFKRKKNCYALKLDISKYFYSIDHEVLKNMLRDKLDEDEFKMVEVIINSTNYPYINKQIENLKNLELSRSNERLDEIKAIPLYEKNKGLPIGNMTSQFLAVYYLNELDHKIVHDFHMKYFIRYMDDFLILWDDLDELKQRRDEIIKILEEKYKLKVNKKKTNITNIKEGFTFCGYRFRIINNKTIINVASETRKRVKRRIKEVRYLYDHNRISLQSAFSSISTYQYGFNYGSKKKMQRLVERYFYQKETRRKDDKNKI